MPILPAQQWRDAAQTAANASLALRDVLTTLGAPPHLVNRINGMPGDKGVPTVTLPSLPADVVEALAEAARRGTT
ncbi:hypothetical protein [Streptomyces sp. NPDC050485]|uniref:hypothetical protein n=1 Tax=Streptomyces sp. NPDC050485 TaxID=3365617 RepID=UPI0037BC1255